MRLTNEKRKGARLTAHLRIACLALLESVIGLLVSPGQVHACKCVEPGSRTEELEKFDAVFAGRVVQIEHSFDLEADSYTPQDRTTILFAVSTVFKGAVAGEMYITTPPPSGSCGLGFVEGEQYVAYGCESGFGNAGVIPQAYAAVPHRWRRRKPTSMNWEMAKPLGP